MFLLAEHVESKELSSDGKIIFHDSVSIDTSKYGNLGSKSKTMTIYLRAHVSYGSSTRKKVEKIAKGQWKLDEVILYIMLLRSNMSSHLRLNFVKQLLNKLILSFTGPSSDFARCARCWAQWKRAAKNGGVAIR